MEDAVDGNQVTEHLLSVAPESVHLVSPVDVCLDLFIGRHPVGPENKVRPKIVSRREPGYAQHISPPAPAAHLLVDRQPAAALSGAGQTQEY